MMQDKIQDNILQFSTLIQSFVNNIQHNATNSKKNKKNKNLQLLQIIYC